MNTTNSILGIIGSTLAITVLLANAGCATKSKSPPQSSDFARGDRYSMAGYEFSARKGVDTPPTIIERFGPPLSDDPAGKNSQYRILTYPAKDQEGKLLLIFHANEMLGVFRDSQRAAMQALIQGHERAQSGQRVLFTAHYGTNEIVRYLADSSQLASAPTLNSDKAPLSMQQAEALAAAWRQRIIPDAPAIPPNIKMFKLKDLPGAAYYCAIVAHPPTPAQNRQILILMDGTIITGELQPR